PNNGALNFDGYYKGDATVVVPVGWKVHVAFRNNDGMLPHSLLVTKPFAEQDLPQLLGADKVAIPRAYTVSPEEGIPAPKTDTVDFTTGDPGKFFFICGAPGHAQSGMWIHFNVDANARAPVLIVATGAEPGWK
ncbi:MAG TPA: sulfocyanin-like copper-binding protein, partial [Candidatus Cybelea sp.]|nr:sulfocyanin-like copper-binding protein [Candidatus Cybelea sp.]